MIFRKYYFKKVRSTNDQAIKMIKRGVESGAIISEVQTHGRGQHGNKWISIKGNLFMTIFYKINKKKSITTITKKNCKIIKKELSKYIKEKVSIKQPNDILINKKKVCGILQETMFNNNKKFLIVGVGINLISSPKVKKYETTYLNNYSKKKITKLSLFYNIKTNYEKNIKYFKFN